MKKSLLALSLLSLGGMFESPKIHDHNIYGYKTNPSYTGKVSMISKEERKKRTKAKKAAKKQKRK